MKRHPETNEDTKKDDCAVFPISLYHNISAWLALFFTALTILVGLSDLNIQYSILLGITLIGIAVYMFINAVRARIIVSQAGIKIVGRFTFIPMDNIKAVRNKVVFDNKNVGPVILLKNGSIVAIPYANSESILEEIERRRVRYEQVMLVDPIVRQWSTADPSKNTSDT